MLRKIGKGLVDLRLVTAALGDCGLQVVGHQGTGDPAIELQCVLGTSHEVLQFLAPTGLHVGVMATAQHAQIYLEFLDLSHIFVRYMELFARKIDEELVARLMGEVHHWRCLLCPFTVPVPELGELEPVRVLRIILFPEQLSRDPRFAEFPVKIGEVPL